MTLCIYGPCVPTNLLVVPVPSLTVSVAVKPLIVIASTCVWGTPAATSCFLSTVFMAAESVFVAATFAATLGCYLWEPNFIRNSNKYRQIATHDGGNSQKSYKKATNSHK